MPAQAQIEVSKRSRIAASPSEPRWRPNAGVSPGPRPASARDVPAALPARSAVGSRKDAMAAVLRRLDPMPFRLAMTAYRRRARRSVNQTDATAAYEAGRMPRAGAASLSAILAARIVAYRAACRSLRNRRGLSLAKPVPASERVSRSPWGGGVPSFSHACNAATAVSSTQRCGPSLMSVHADVKDPRLLRKTPVKVLSGDGFGRAGPIANNTGRNLASLASASVTPALETRSRQRRVARMSKREATGLGRTGDVSSWSLRAPKKGRSP